MKIDDPVDVGSVHGFGGFIGLILAPLLSQDGVILQNGSKHSLHYLGWNLVAAVCIILWSISFTLMCFGPLAYFNILGNINLNEESFKMREIITGNRGKCFK